MKSFKYIKPGSIEETVLALNNSKTELGNSAKVLAGGTDLLGTIKTRISSHRPDRIISLKGAGLDYIKKSSDGIHIGAASTLHAIERSQEIAETLPLLRQAAHSVASPQIRHQATLGGNVCQEPRCWYYRYPDNKFDCMRKGGKLCNALTGNNPYHSVLGAAKVCKSPCELGCPNGTDIPGYFDAVRKGDFSEAAKILMQVNPMAAVTGRVCPHLCQDECNRDEFDESVSIRSIERFIGDYTLENIERFIPLRKTGSGKRVAVIGGGPAGMTAAHYLIAKGHDVTVFDKNEKAGGMLRYAIPSYRLPEEIVDKIAGALERAGVTFVLGKAVDPNKSAQEYCKDFDAVLIACGSWKDNRISFDGSDHALSGLDFLYQISTGEQEKPGNRVAVIGGGNVAMDVAVSARRMGCEVTVIYRRTKEEMPAFAWEVEEALAEGVTLMTSLAPHRILKKDGKTVGIEAVKSLSAGGRKGDVALNLSDTITIDTDCVIMAIGQKTDTLLFADVVPLNEKDQILIDEKTQATRQVGIFAAGDAVKGPATVVEAIAGGRRAAFGIHEYLTGEAFDAEKVPQGEPLFFDLSALAQAKPADEADGLSETAVKAEAMRCFNCGCVAVTPSDIAPALIALDAEMITTRRTIKAGEFFKAGIESSTVLNEDEVLTEVFIPWSAVGNHQFYQKFRTRKTIDFPIAGLASNLSVTDGKITSAKLVLSAAAPVPYELSEVEAFLLGKAPEEAVGALAGKLAVKGMTPLAENAYKIQVFQTFVKRAVCLLESEV